LSNNSNPASEAKTLYLQNVDVITSSGPATLQFYGGGADFSLVSAPSVAGKDLALKASYQDDCTMCDHRVYFQVFKYEPTGWLPDQSLNSGKGLVYVNPLPVVSITPDSFFKDFLDSLTTGGILSMGTRVVRAVSCVNLKSK
jgi:hypothetical protein